jgi:hypothetical protein
MEEKHEMPSHHPGSRKGEELAGGDEPGREETGTTGAGRPTGKSTARDFTGINPDLENPIEEDMPHLTEG